MPLTLFCIYFHSRAACSQSYQLQIDWLNCACVRMVGDRINGRRGRGALWRNIHADVGSGKYTKTWNETRSWETSNKSNFLWCNAVVNHIEAREKKFCRWHDIFIRLCFLRHIKHCVYVFLCEWHNKLTTMISFPNLQLSFPVLLLMF